MNGLSRSRVALRVEPDVELQNGFATIAVGCRPWRTGVTKPANRFERMRDGYPYETRQGIPID